MPPRRHGRRLPNETSLHQTRGGSLSSKDQMEEVKSTIRRISLLTDNPALEYSLGQLDNVLNFRDIIDSGTCVIYSLRRLSGDARKLIGAFLMLGYEKAALSRNPYSPGLAHQLLIDEFSQFSAQSADALNTILSETRKFKLFVTMAHQTRVQLNDKTLGGLQNVWVNAAFQLGDEDAREMARVFGRVDPSEIKHEVADPQALERTHPTFYSMPEQWEKWVQALKELPPRHLLVKVGRGAGEAFRIKTPNMPKPNISYDQIELVKGLYRDRLMKPQEAIELPHQKRLTPTVRTAPRSAPM